MSFQFKNNRFAKFLAVFLVFTSVVISSSAANAQRALSPQLLPQETLVYARITNLPEFVKSFKETAFAKMFQDPAIRPLVEDLYKKASEAADEAKEKTGLTLDQLLNIPQGEIAFAVVGREKKDPMFVVILDAGENAKDVHTLLQKAQESSGRDLEQETIEGQKVMLMPARGEQPVLFERDNSFVLCSSADIVPDLIKNWNGREKESFNDNPKFTAIKNTFHTKESDPQLIAYVNPLGLFSAFAQTEARLQIAMSIIDAIGLNGLQAVGGSIAFNNGDFDSLVEAHALLDSPRNGVLDTLQMKEGDVTPQPWVPANLAGYSTIYWDVPETYNRVEKLIDSFFGANRTSNWINQNLSSKIDVDVVKEIMPLVKGRGTMLTIMPKPKPRDAADAELDGPPALMGGPFQGSEMLFAIELTDVNKAKKIFDQLIGMAGDEMVKKTWGSQTYYVAKISVPERGRRRGPVLPEPCFTIAHDCLIMSSFPGIMKDVLSVHEAKDTLAESLEFKLMVSKLKRVAGTGKVGAIVYNRPEESMKYMWDIALAEQTRQRMREAGENNPVLSKLDEALTQHPLPPFSAVEKYFLPTGSVVTNEDNGFHYRSFSLKRKLD